MHNNNILYTALKLYVLHGTLNGVVILVHEVVGLVHNVVGLVHISESLACSHLLSCNG